MKCAAGERSGFLPGTENVGGSGEGACLCEGRREKGKIGLLVALGETARHWDFPFLPGISLFQAGGRITKALKRASSLTQAQSTQPSQRNENAIPSTSPVLAPILGQPNSSPSGRLRSDSDSPSHHHEEISQTFPCYPKRHPKSRQDTGFGIPYLK